MIKWMFALMSLPTGATCVSDLNYPTRLHLPRLEHWARDTVFGVPSAELECNMVRKLIGLLDDLETRDPSNAPPRRRTHAKGVCVAGTFQPRLEARLGEERQSLLRNAEIFATPGPRAVHARFANASPRVRPDWVKDVRALSFKVDLGGGRSQDFAFNNVPRFQIDGLDTFNLLMETTLGVLAGQIEQTADGPSLRSLFGFFQSKVGTLAAARALYALSNLKTLVKKDSGWHDSYLTQTYWSVGAFALGETNRDVGELSRVVKFGAVPCNEKSGRLNSEIEAKNASRLKGLERPNYLGEDLRSTIARTPACFKMFVEFLDQEKSVTGAATTRARQLIEDPSLVWRAPSYVVGELTFDRAVDATTCDDPARAIHVTGNASGIVGVGQINRARAYLEDASQKAR